MSNIRECGRDCEYVPIIQELYIVLSYLKTNYLFTISCFLQRALSVDA